MHKWKIVPLSKGQLTDIRKEDILENGHFRICETYRGGGGYDMFPSIAKEIFGKTYDRQFVVQLYGCNLDCPYCYVTREGVWGNFVEYTTNELVSIFDKYNLNVFHLMGGAPGLQLKFWPELLYRLNTISRDFIFHSDLMLTEQLYSPYDLNMIKNKNLLIAINIKGYDKDEWYKNTRKEWDKDLFQTNLETVNNSEINYYITFTNVSKNNIEKFLKENKENLTNSITNYSIDLIQYNALPYVDNVPWGKNGKNTKLSLSDRRRQEYKDIICL